MGECCDAPFSSSYNFTFNLLRFARNLMPNYRVDKLIIDFDETITEKDTIELLVNTAVQTRRSDKLQIMKAWRQTVEWYLVCYARICDEWLNSWQRPGEESVANFLRTFETLEMASIARVMEHRFLAGLRRKDLRALERQVRKRTGVKACLLALREADVAVDILSANWSQTLVEESLRGLCDDVVANSLCFDEDGFSVGEIHLRVVSAHDKLRFYCANRAQTGLTVYVGDSISDLLAIIEADIGILLGNNLTCLRTINRFQIPMQKITQLANQEDVLRGCRSPGQSIFQADSWTTVNHFLERVAGL